MAGCPSLSPRNPSALSNSRPPLRAVLALSPRARSVSLAARRSLPLAGRRTPSLPLADRGAPLCPIRRPPSAPRPSPHEPWALRAAPIASDGKQPPRQSPQTASSPRAAAPRDPLPAPLPRSSPRARPATWVAFHRSGTGAGPGSSYYRRSWGFPSWSQPTTGFGMGGKRRGGQLTSAGKTGNQAVSLREESSGKTRVDEASLLCVKHLQGLAAWAGAEDGIGPVGALLGRCLAASAEAAGVPVGAATFLCQRCETILRPGFNCTVRIRNKKNKTKRRKKSNCSQNSVAYACHFCEDRNLILGSGKGVVKSLLSSREQASMDSTHRNFRGNKSNTRTLDMKEVHEHSQAAILQVDPSSRLTQSTSSRVEQNERLKNNLITDCRMEEGATLSSMESCHLAVSTFEVGSIQKIVSENAKDEHMQETEPVSYGNSSTKIETCEPSVTLETDFLGGSKFITPQKNRLMDSAEPFNTKSTINKKGQASHSAAAKTLSSSKSVPSKSATSDAAQVSGSSRKRTRRGWTTLKQIAEKDEIERKEKMDHFVIPFFMQ